MFKASLVVAAVIAVATTFSAPTPIFPPFYGSPGSNLGTSLAMTADLTGDGRADLVAGACKAMISGAPNCGEVRVYDGATGALHLSIPGNGADDYFGFQVACADIDGDGQEDLIISTPQSNGSTGTGDGRLVVYSGASVIVGSPLAIATVSGPSGSFFGERMVVDDLDHDQKSEIIIGINREQRAQVFTWQSSALVMMLEIARPTHQFGFGVGSADIDGDGIREVLISDLLPGAQGNLWGFDFPTGTQIFGSTGPGAPGIIGASDSYFGVHATALPDIDGDGCEEIAVAASGESFGGGLTHNGAVHVFSGATRTELSVLLGSVSHERMGAALTTIPDVDGDGIRELVVGSLGAGVPSSSSVGVYSGASLTGGGAVPLVTVVDPTPGDNHFGQAVAGGQDLDADGLDDLAVGATDASGTAGAVHTFRLGIEPPPVEDLLPTADAGADQATHAGSNVTLDGSGSFDDNTPVGSLGFLWTWVQKPAGSTAELSNYSVQSPQFVADLPGTYVASLTVYDSIGQASTSDAVTISSTNVAPTANAGVNQGTMQCSLVALDGTGSHDPEGDALSFSWAFVAVPVGSAAVLGGSVTPTPYFTADEPGDYVLALVVHDGFESSAIDTVTIAVVSGVDYAESTIAAVLSQLRTLPECAFSDRGNRKRFMRFLTDALRELRHNDIEEAREEIERALERTDGVYFRGEPDDHGRSRDWVVSTSDNLATYTDLKAAFDALSSCCQAN